MPPSGLVCHVLPPWCACLSASPPHLNRWRAREGSRDAWPTPGRWGRVLAERGAKVRAVSTQSGGRNWALVEHSPGAPLAAEAHRLRRLSALSARQDGVKAVAAAAITARMDFLKLPLLTPPPHTLASEAAVHLGFLFPQPAHIPCKPVVGRDGLSPSRTRNSHPSIPLQ